MNLIRMRMVLGLAIAASVIGTAQAQPGGQRPTFNQYPTFSPYLNLNRPGTSPAINYFGIVRPQFQALSTFQSLEQQAAANRQAISDAAGAPATALPTTGHPVAFLNTAGYFMNLNPSQQGNIGFGNQGGIGFGTGFGTGGMGGGLNRIGSGQGVRNTGGTMGRPR